MPWRRTSRCTRSPSAPSGRSSMLLRRGRRAPGPTEGPERTERTEIRSMFSRTGRFLAVLIVPALVLAASSASAEAPAKKTGPKKTIAKTLPPIFDPDALGTKAVDAAVEVCNESSRRMFIVLGTNDCPSCRVFNDVLVEQEFFKDFIQQFVPVLIDVSSKGPNVDFLKNYR